MKTNFFDIALALGWRAARIFRTSLFKKSKYFISNNDLSYSPRDFQCGCARRIWGRTQTDRWVLGRKNHFFETELFVCFLILLLFSLHKSQRENLRAFALVQTEILRKSFDKVVFYKAKSLCKKVWVHLLSRLRTQTFMR